MRIPTIEPLIWIVEKTAYKTVYETDDGTESWEITGSCNACGACEVGAADADYQIWTGIPVGQAGACLDNRFGTRLDIPVRPELTEKTTSCTLKGTYLHGN